MNKRTLLGLTIALALLVATQTPLLAQYEPGEPVAVCYTRTLTGTCGSAATGPSITCEDGSGGPQWIRVAPQTHECKQADQNEGGQKKCNNSGSEVAEKLKTYHCDDREGYTLRGEEDLQTCPTAQLSGSECSG